MDAYKRVIDDNNGQTMETTVSLQYTDSEYMVLEVGFMKGIAHLDIAHAIAVRDAIDEALMLMQIPDGFYPVNATPPF